MSAPWKSGLMAVFCSALVGAAIWWGSKSITGELEPWDSAGSYLPLSLAFASLLLGFVFFRSPLYCTLGLYVGQAGYLLLFLPKGPLIGAGLLFLVIYTGIPSVPCSMIGAMLRRGFIIFFARKEGVPIDDEPPHDDRSP